MYCPNCSTLAVEGAKFCKLCGLNLNVIIQSLNGGVPFSDPSRDREYKRARKQVSEGINGTAIGAAMLVGAVLIYLIIKDARFAYPITLLLALFGLVKLFRSIGSIVDAKVGNRFLDGNLHGKSTTGELNVTGNLTPQSDSRNPGDFRKSVPITTRTPSTGSLTSATANSTPFSSTLPPAGAAINRPSTGRVNREQSSPLKKLEIDDDLLSKLRN